MQSNSRLVRVIAWIAITAFTNNAMAGVIDLASAPLVTGLGKTVSPMRPSGTVEFDNARVDAMTEGVMIDAGVFVRCIDVKGGKVIVRQMDAPKDITDINLDGPTPAQRRDALDDFDLDLK